MKQLSLADAVWFIKTSKHYINPNGVIEWGSFCLNLPLAYYRYKKASK